LKIGYFLSSEEWGPNEQLEQARMAEEAGFEALWISDHYHPWTEEQGNSPFVWSVIGGLSQVTSRVKVVTAVTCPTMRIHPAIMAQATATSAVMLPGRFEFGVGTGENLNEHIFGDRWPPTDVRLEMLEEAIEVIRLLWEGGTKSHEGKHYRVENARIYTLPDEPPPILVSGFGPKSIQLAATSTSPPTPRCSTSSGLRVAATSPPTAPSRSAMARMRRRPARPHTGSGPTMRFLASFPRSYGLRPTLSRPPGSLPRR